MNTLNLQEVIFRKVDQQRNPFDHLSGIENSMNGIGDGDYSSEEEQYYTSSESNQDVKNDSELCVNTRSYEAWASSSDNEVYYQKLNARIVFPESYKCSVGRKPKSRAFQMENIFGDRSDRYSNFIRAIKNQHKCEYCIKDECYCQDESQVLLTALARNIFLSNGLDKNVENSNLEGFPKFAIGYPENINQAGKYSKPKDVRKEYEKNVYEQLLSTYYPSKPAQEMKTNEETADKVLIRKKKIENIETEYPTKSKSRQAPRKGQTQTKQVQRVRNLQPELVNEIDDQGDPQMQKTRQQKSKHTKTTVSPRNGNSGRHTRMSPKKIYSENTVKNDVPNTLKITSSMQNSSDASVTKQDGIADSSEPKHIREGYVDVSSSVPLKICQSCATDTKSTTKTSLCSQTCSTIVRPGILKKSHYSMENISHPICDCGILNTYKKELIYMLDKIMEEIQRMKMKKCKCKTKRVCFGKHANTQTNQRNRLEEHKPCFCHMKQSRQYYNGFTYNKTFEEMDGNDYIRILLRSKIVQMEGFDDILDEDQKSI